MKGCCGGNEQKDGVPPTMGNMDEEFNPMEMCKNMMETIMTAAKMAGYATPEVRALFEDWASQVEDEVLAVVKQKGRISPSEVAQELKVSENTALYFISKLIRDKKIKVTGLELI